AGCVGGSQPWKDNVQADKERRNQERSWRAAVHISNQVPMVVDKAITKLEPVIGKSSRPTMEEERSEDLPVEDVEGVPLSIFEEEASDDEEGELNWMDMIGITVGQTDLEPKDSILDATSSLIRREEAEIKKITPNNSVGVWIFKYQEENKIDLPFVSISLYHAIIEKKRVFGQPVFGLNARELIRDMNVPIVKVAEAPQAGSLSSNDQSKLEIHLSSNIPNHDDRLKVISVDEFYLIYNGIAMKNGLKLSEYCGGNIIVPKSTLNNGRNFYQLLKTILLLAAGEELPPHMDQGVPQKLLIGHVIAIWMVQKPVNQSSYFFHTTLFQKLDENGFYRMREIQKTSHKAFVHTSRIVTGLNVQHHCHRGGCQLTQTRTAIFKQRKSQHLSLELTHKDNERYVVNLASLALPALHRKASGIVLKSVDQLAWINVSHDGLRVWCYD
ncbi:hypothetical protein MJO28_006238, partial [Puccinia striiformis f. sp. tritici]